MGIADHLDASRETSARLISERSPGDGKRLIVSSDR
jgi:hypothetical protein